MEENKYEKALSLYNCEISDEEVKAAVKKIIAEKVPANDTPEVKKFLMGSVELTTLKTTDSEESVMAFTERVNDFDEQYPDLPHVATICVYPCFAKTVAETLEVDGVEIACVSGSFPSSQALIEVKVAETALAVKDGATEIDIVMSVGKFLSGNYEEVADEIAELKAVCGEKKMKVILETGCLKTAANIKKASILSMYAGADYIKTSTGKLEPAATPEAAYVMCQAIKEYYEKTGWFQACWWTQYAHGCCHHVHHRQRSPGREMAHQPVVPYGNLTFGQPTVERGYRCRYQILLINSFAERRNRHRLSGLP